MKVIGKDEKLLAGRLTIKNIQLLPEILGLDLVFKQPVAYWIRGSWLFFLRKLAEETKAIGELILLQRLDWIFYAPEEQNYSGLVPW